MDVPVAGRRAWSRSSRSRSATRCREGTRSLTRRRPPSGAADGAGGGRAAAPRPARSQEAEAAEPPRPPARRSRAPAPARPRAAATPAYASPARAPPRARARRRPRDACTGTGRKGRITKEDVEARQGARRRPAAAPARGAAVAGLDLAPWPKVDFEKYGEVERVPLSRIQKISGPNLARNWVMIPHVTHNDEADITELEAFRKRSTPSRSEREGDDGRAAAEGAAWRR